MSHDGSITAVGTRMESYYGRPILKEPVWQPEIPCYFFTGGLAGASSILHVAAKLAGNVTLASLRRFSRVSFIDRSGELDAAREQIKSLDLRPPNPQREVRLFSGGNQQKVVLAR